MTLNFSSCSIIPTSIRADDDFASARRDRSEGFGIPCRSSWEFEDEGNGGWGEVDGPYDPIDLLPSDPFGMDLSTTFTAAIAGWIGGFGSNSCDCKVDSGRLVAGLSYYWNRALLSSSEAQLSFGGVSEGWVDGGFSGLSGYEAQDGFFAAFVDLEELPSSSGAEAAASGGDEGVPHEGFLFSLGYLGVRDLLSVEMVCRSLRSAVQSDPLLWRCIRVDSPLSEKITDGALFRLAQKAQGNLQCLSLVGCSRITDDGLRRVLENNLRLRKLSVPGCVRLTVEGLINNLKTLKTSGISGIKRLKLGKLFSISQEHFEELKLLLDIDQSELPTARKPRFYHSSCSSLDCDDECGIDIEMCPGCQKFKLVYDCPSESCQQKGPEQCRACDVCIPRCVQCGKCIKDCKYVETFCLEYLCSGCWKHPLVIQGGMEK